MIVGFVFFLYHVDFLKSCCQPRKAFLALLYHYESRSLIDFLVFKIPAV